MDGKIDFEGLAHVLLSHCPGVLHEWFPSGKLQGQEFCVGNLQGDAGDSLKINTTTGEWSDFATRDKGRDLISVYAGKQGLKNGEAAKELLKQFGLWREGSPAKIGKPPLDAPPPTMIHNKFGKSTAHWLYHDKEGDPLFYIARYDPPEEKKQIVPWSFDLSKNKWISKAFLTPRPLYGVDQLIKNPKSAVLIVEGEKAADAARKMLASSAYIITTWPGGSQALSKIDWQPLFNREKILLWPDNDEPGLAAMKAIGNLLSNKSKEIKFINPAGEPDGFDAADLFERGVHGFKAWSEWASPKVSLFKQVQDSEELPPPQYSDDAIAGQFAKDYADKLRYVPDLSWFEWDGKRWLKVPTVHVVDLCRKTARQFALMALIDSTLTPTQSTNLSRSLASIRTITAIEKLIRGDSRHLIAVTELDKNLWVINTPGGTIDLRTGACHPHNPSDKITKMTLAEPAGECPRWHEFLERVTGGSQDMKNYLQRLCGYCLVGDPSEECVDFFYGSGGNGKGTFLETIRYAMGDYATGASMDTFTESRHDKHPTDVAKLYGARLVIAQEVDEGKSWDESRIKAFTGRDILSARYMRQDFFDFKPQFKLIIAGNHRPALKTVDEAMRRRFHLVPFEITIPAAERDPDLKSKLCAEANGVLVWMIEGCKLWQAQGLKPPEVILAATEDYFQDEDIFGLWLEECCQLHQEISESSNLLYQSYTDWKMTRGERTLSQKKFVGALHDRKFFKRKSMGLMIVQGIGLSDVELARLKEKTERSSWGNNARFGKDY